ncbi:MULTISPECIES: efflux RND transporter periplasmic adaptor subunit [Methylobacterium]|uniref:p-hydroxybenzoic acid efflux pump subunit AaeA n=2 Tax=Methylobacterium thuringiense TaxID=1003091 RepID=A0ABQ4TQF3_9HYPH|nr:MULTISPECIES: efflux RND transporter periplasmic adaptor subunit [Methylobacterium]TXN24686.1 efflux RND transporter periplasmic adaptor subunit [Methylobacterium sp. WL9]GJE56847.1 p-hydroxybenzoic acid efflux pump subunit AaeA [Methylobacterium thuringiense]
MTSRPVRHTQLLALSLLAAWMATSAGVAQAQETRVDCVVEPAQKLKIGSATLGILKSVPVNRGTTVNAGDVIARLDSSVEEANVALSRAQAESVATIEAQQTRVELYKRRLDRQSQLSKGIVTQERLDQVEADYEIGRRDLQTEILKRKLAGIELMRTEAQLELRMIRSPIRGIVTERLMSAGEFVRQDSAIFTLVQLDPLYVEAYLPVSRWKEISLGMATTVELDQPIGGTYEAKVTVVDHVFDAASGTFGVRLELPNPDFKLPGGQRCKVGFPLPQKGPLATAVPFGR